jgi:putative tryptophan/tyrosine transport system substrate-binding protein
MRRREFVTFLGCAAIWSPLIASAQPSKRRIVVLMPTREDDEDGRARLTAFKLGLAQLGWTNGPNLHIDFRWAIDSADKEKAAVAELQANPPDVIVASTSHSVAAVLRATPTVPLVFAMIYEPVAQGFVKSLAHPGGNATGFTNVEASIGAKWLELLLEMAPGLARVAYMCNTNNPGPLQPYSAAEAAGRDHHVTVALADVHDATGIESTITALAGDPGGGLIVPPDGFLSNYRKQIIELAARGRLPAIYGLRSFAVQGGLASYGAKVTAQFNQAAVYVDRILRGEKPANLPVQEPTEYALIINLKAAKTLGLNVPPMVLATADEVIE